MVCDNCGKNKNTTKMSVVTGKRGRPPVKNYCDSCIKELGSKVRAFNEDRPKVQKAFREPPQKALTNPVSASEPRKRGRPPGSVQKKLEGFDSACLFLLDYEFSNLFEPAHANTDWHFRCKGCREEITRAQRREHFTAHRVAYKAVA